MDIRREWSLDEELLLKFLGKIEKPAVLALTKADKLSKNQAINKRRQLEQASGLETFITSAEKKLGISEVENHFFQTWIREDSSAKEAAKEAAKEESEAGDQR